MSLSKSTLNLKSRNFAGTEVEQHTSRVQVTFVAPKTLIQQQKVYSNLIFLCKSKITSLHLQAIRNVFQIIDFMIAFYNKKCFLCFKPF